MGVPAPLLCTFNEVFNPRWKKTATKEKEREREGKEKRERRVNGKAITNRKQ
jgi:hypothetical protein